MHDYDDNNDCCDDGLCYRLVIDHGDDVYEDDYVHGYDRFKHGLDDHDGRVNYDRFYYHAIHGYVRDDFQNDHKKKRMQK